MSGPVLGSIVVAAVSAVAAVVGPVLMWLRGRRADHPDIVAKWESNYGLLMARFETLQAQLEAESESRLALEGQLRRALARIDHLERILEQHDIGYDDTLPDH